MALVSPLGGNWSSPSTWVGGSVPPTGDNITFNASSGNLTVDVNVSVANFNLLFYTKTLTLFSTFTLTVTGDLDLGEGGYTLAGTGFLNKAGTGTITSGGLSWPLNFRFATGGTTTLLDDLNLTGGFNFHFSPGTATVNGFNIYHTGTFLLVSNGGIIAGNTKYWYKGTGTTWALANVAAQINIDFYIDTIGTLGISSTSIQGVLFGGNINKELKVISGTLVTSSLSALTLIGRTIDFNGNIINTLRISNSTQTTTLLSATTVNTLIIAHSGSVTQTITGFEINTNNLSITGIGNATSITQGDTVINFVGAGTGTWSQAGTGAIRNNININKTLGSTLNITGTVYYNTGILTYIQGIVNTTGNTFICNGVATINSSGDPISTSPISSTGINFNNFQTPGGLVTNATPIRIIGTLTHLYNCTGAVYVNGSLVVINNSVGTGTSITLNGTGSWTGAPAVRGVNLIIDTLGTITANTNVSISDATITYVKGTVNTGIGAPGGGGTLTVTTACTFNTTNIIAGSLPWNKVVVIVGTQTLASNLTCQDLSYGSTTSFNQNTIFINRNLTITSSTSVAGTTLLNMQGTGTWSNTGNAIGNYVRHNLTLSGTITIPGLVSFAAGKTLTTTGSINASGSSLYLGGNTSTIVNSTAIWNDVFVSGGTQTINSQLLIGGTLFITGTTILTFAGTFGFTAANVSCTTAGRIITLASGKTYNVTNNLNLVGTNASKITLTSGTPRAIFTLPYGATQNVKDTSATNIDSSLGQTILSSAGVLNNTLNWSIGSGNFFLMF